MILRTSPSDLTSRKLRLRSVRMRADPPRAGDVVLMHDDNAATHAALERMLPEWRAAGFALRGLPQRGRA